jgi:hypothetical protein
MPCDRSPGFRFKEGKLYAFTATGVMVLESWPVLRALRKAEGGPWEEFAPAFRVVRPYRPRPAKPSAQLEFDLGPAAAPRPRDSLAAQRKRAFDSFRFSLPRPVAARAEKFQSRQWALLRLFHARPETLEFAEQNPALCFALGNFPCFVAAFLRQALDEAVKMSGCRQREIAGWLGFPPTDGAARILAKLAPESASVELMQPLREALKNPDVAKTLAHLPRLNAGVTAIALEPRLLAASTPKLLGEVAGVPTEKYRADTAQLIHDTLRMFFQVHPRRGTPQFQSIARVREIHDEVSVEYLRREDPALQAFRFPQPPLPGTPEIVPICTLEELIDEGRLQDNCVATYAERVQARRTFIYRVFRPERATLSIVRRADGDWEIGQLERRANTRVAPTTRQWVEAWLEEHALSA